MAISGVLFLAFAYTRLFARTRVYTQIVTNSLLLSLFFRSPFYFLHIFFVPYSLRATAGAHPSCKISLGGVALVLCSILYWIECRRPICCNGRTFFFQFSLMRKSLLASPLGFCLFSRRECEIF